MKQILNITKVAALLALALAVTVPVRAGDLKAASGQAIQNFKLADPGLTRFFENSAGYVVLPSVGEGGLIIGGQRGDGLVYQKGKVIGKVTMTEISIGAQAGGGQFSEVIFYETNAACSRCPRAGPWWPPRSVDRSSSSHRFTHRLSRRLP
jgi:lipid-binding SYLF domain-containing protein